MSDTPLLEIRDLSKTFGSVQALTDVDFEVRAGEVMALVGDNGAGKSTLIKCVAGIHGYDSGEISFDGEAVSIHGPKDAANLGIEVVYQDLALCDNLDVVQNMFLGRERLRSGTLDEEDMETAARETTAERPESSDFPQVADQYRRELTAHCYRMTGSVYEAEDMVQETYLRAWKAYDDFEGRA